MGHMSSFGPLAEAEVTYVGDMDEAGMIKSCLLQIGLPAVGTREKLGGRDKLLNILIY